LPRSGLLLVEIRAAALIHKGIRLDPSAVPAMAAVEMATLSGARALKLDHLTGSLEAGKRADLVVLNLDVDNLVPMYNTRLSHLAYAAATADMRAVPIDDRMVMEDGNLLTLDEAEVRSRVRGLAAAIGPLPRTRRGSAQPQATAEPASGDLFLGRVRGCECAQESDGFQRGTCIVRLYGSPVSSIPP
jgi:hypothetical protein